MNIKEMLSGESERAVSPVIGVILMVAITVILAAVIGAFVIGIGEDQEVQPTASFNFDFESDQVTISHSTGDSISAPDELDIVIDGEDESWIPDEESDTVSAGNQVTITAGSSGDIDASGDTDSDPFADALAEDSSATGTFDYDGQTVSIVWTSETGDSSATLSSQDAPSS